MLYSTKTVKILQTLGLIRRVQDKIKMCEVLAVTQKDQGNVRIDISECAWALVRNVVLVNCNALNECIPESWCATHTPHQERHLFRIRRKRKESPNEVSPLDVFFAVYRCCDPVLRQFLVRKMYLCKLAVPFMYNRVDSLSPIIDTWPLRSLNLYQDTTELGNVLTMKTNVVTFARIGRPNFSKSQCLNAILSGQNNVKQVFFDRECNGGNRTKIISEGITEVFWLPLHPENICFDTTVTFFNIRGPLDHYKGTIVLHLINSISDCIIVIVESDFFYNI